MKNTITFECYNDPGHGWMKVKMAQIDKLGIREKISSYSYIRGEFAYLEEDCDAGLFINALAEKGVTAKLRHHFTDKQSKIRSYGRYPYWNYNEEFKFA